MRILKCTDDVGGGGEIITILHVAYLTEERTPWDSYTVEREGVIVIGYGQACLYNSVEDWHRRVSIGEPALSRADIEYGE